MTPTRSRRSLTVVLISLSDPSVPDSGKNVVIRGFLEHLVRRLEPGQLHLVHLGGPLRRPETLPGVQIHELGRRDLHELPGNLVHGLLRRRSLQESFTRSRRRAADVRAALQNIDADIEIVDTVRAAQYLDGHRSRGRRVLYLDDLYSVRYRRMITLLDQGIGDFDPLGQFRYHLPSFLWPLIRVNFLRTALLRYEAPRMERAERARTREYGGALLLNSGEARALSQQTGLPVEVVPPTVATGARLDAWQGDPDFGFIGLLSLPHNHDGLIWFLRDVFPLVLQRRPDARLHVVGKDPKPDLLEAVRGFGESVVMHGFVPDLDATMASQAGLVIPLRFGSGVKIKALEALARAVPIVGTPVAAEGIVEDDRPGFAVRETPEALAQALLALLDPEVRKRAAADADALFEQTFSQGAAGRRYDEAFGLNALDPVGDGSARQA